MAQVSYTPMGTLFGRTLPWWKRCVDIGGSLVGLIVLLPLFIAMAAYVKLVSPGPVFFSQERIGHRGRAFRLWKFRTMAVGTDPAQHREYLAALIHGDPANASGRGEGRPMRKLEQDPRIIPLGRVIRALCLDEFPQLFNVLRGDMTLIGPRPAIPYEADAYAPWHRGRFDAVPGMTGLWQVSGKNRLTFNEMVRLDIRYARSLSIWMDAWILLRTAPAIAAQLSDDIL